MMPRTGRIMGASRARSARAIAVASLAALALAACVEPPRSTPGAASTRFGWIDGKCIAVMAPVTGLPRTILLAPDTPGAPFATARIVAEADRQSGCTALMAERAQINWSAGHSFYVIETDRPVELAIGILDAREDRSVRYDHCFTSEGVRFSVSDGQRIVWQDYYYLGYDVEPTCQ